MEERLTEVPNLDFILTKALPCGKRNGVYFLFWDKELVYIGKTTRGVTRIFQHQDKAFNKYFFFEVPLEELDCIEAELINKYRPPYNIIIPRPFLSEFLKNRRIRREIMEYNECEEACHEI